MWGQNARKPQVCLCLCLCNGQGLAKVGAMSLMRQGAGGVFRGLANTWGVWSCLLLVGRRWVCECWGWREGEGLPLYAKGGIWVGQVLPPGGGICLAQPECLQGQGREQEPPWFCVFVLPGNASRKL